jgi:Uncharacterised protein family (UPF0236)
MSVEEIVASVTAQMSKDLEVVVGMLEKDGLSPSGFRDFIAALSNALNRAGRDALVAAISRLDRTEDVVEHGGERHRFKMTSAKRWLTRFGGVAIGRRYYQPDNGGDGVVPLDVACGMVDRYLTPDIEEHSAFAAALLTPNEVEKILARLLPEAPSAKAIQRVIEDVGGFAEADADEVAAAIQRGAPLSAKGDTLAVSWDGKLVPMREPGVKTGRPPERPGIRKEASTPTTWREAGVTSLSIYGGLSDDGKPIREDCQYLARMPENGMRTMLDRMLAQVGQLRATRKFSEVIVICDGKPAIWSVAETAPELEGATLILDFYHAIEHLSKAAEAIFGKRKAEADEWFKAYRDRLQLDRNGAVAAIRSMRYYCRNLRANSERRHTIRNVVRYFNTHRRRMAYANYIERGLPIGSGPVEAACKTVVGARLNRSGMRWSRQGGQHVLNLRTQHLSNRWSVFWNTYLEARAA